MSPAGGPALSAAELEVVGALESAWPAARQRPGLGDGSALERWRTAYSCSLRDLPWMIREAVALGKPVVLMVPSEDRAELGRRALARMSLGNSLVTFEVAG